MAGLRPVLKNYPPSDTQAIEFGRQRSLINRVMDYKDTNGEYPTTDPETFQVFAGGEYIAYISMRARLRNLLHDYLDISHRVKRGEIVELFQVQMEIYDKVVEVEKDARKGLVLDNNLESEDEGEPSPKGTDSEKSNIDYGDGSEDDD